MGLTKRSDEIQNPGQHTQSEQHPDDHGDDDRAGTTRVAEFSERHQILTVPTAEVGPILRCARMGQMSVLFVRRRRLVLFGPGFVGSSASGALLGFFGRCHPRTLLPGRRAGGAPQPSTVVGRHPGCAVVSSTASRHHREMDSDVPAADPIGRLSCKALLATPVIGDERFAQAVILIVNHDDDGALGLVLNEPGYVAVAETLPVWADRTGPPALVFMGGPMSTDRALGLARLDVDTPADRGGPAFTGLPGWPDTDDTVGLVDLSADPGDLAASVHSVRVFAGYAGWGPGQLESELSVGAWWTTAVRAADVLGDDPSTLWTRVVARQPGSRALFARFPGDPGLN